MSIYISERDSELLLDEILDSDGVVTIFGMDFLPSAILKTLDPIAYRESLLNLLDSEDLTTEADEAENDDEEDEFYPEPYEVTDGLDMPSYSS